MKNFKIKSYCKINLTLRVLKKLNNGYHNIMSLITFCDLHDVISISKISNSKDKISFSGRFKKGINKKLNTATKVSAWVSRILASALSVFGDITLPDFVSHLIKELDPAGFA